MQLKKLDAYGFKSFADKIEIEFDKGITAIVGPNGTGKSNVTDAIRWVLGEQNVRALRGAKLEDIIFSGSSSRKQLGVAEVSLILLNEGDLAIDYEEVVISRRIFRSGESEYYINKARCRLKDILNLLADTGIGQDGMSVISQNKIDEVLNSKPEDRRLLFDETAGITKYRTRKKESINKLEETEQNLNRASDIITEVETQLYPLAEQAERTCKYNKLNEEYKKCQLTELWHQYKKSDNEKREKTTILKALNDEMLEKIAQKKLRESEKQDNAQLILQKEVLLQDIAKENMVLHEEIEALSAEIKIEEERRENRDFHKKQIKEKQNILEKQCQEEYEEQKILKINIKKLSEKKEIVSKILWNKKDEAKKIAKKIKEKNGRIDDLLGEREKVQKIINQQEKEYALIMRDIEADEEKRRNNKKTENVLKEEIIASEKKVKMLEEKYENIKNERCVFLKEQKNIEYIQKKRDEKIDKQRREVNSLRLYIDQAETKLKVLKHMQQNYEGFGKSEKAILRNYEVWDKKICGAVAEVLNVPEKFLLAVQASLGMNLQNIIVEDAETVKKAIVYLKKSNLGRVTFLPLDILEDRKSPNEEIKGIGIIGWLNTLLSTETKYKKVLNYLTAHILVVDNLDHAIEIIRKNKVRVRIVTLDGEIFNVGGAITGGSQRKNYGFISRSIEIKALGESIFLKKREIEKCNKDLQEEILELEKLKTKNAEIKDFLDELSIKSTKINLEIDLFYKEIVLKRTRLKEILEYKKRQEVTFSKLQERKMGSLKSIDESTVKIYSIREEIALEKEMLSEYISSSKEIAQKVNEKEIEHAILEQEILRNQEKDLLLVRNIERATQEIGKIKKELQNVLNSNIEGAEKIKQLIAEKSQKVLKYQSVTDLQQQEYEKKMLLLVSAQEIDKKINNFSQQISKLENKINNNNIEISQKEFEIKQCKKILEDDFGKNINEVESDVLDISGNVLFSRIKSLKEEIQQLGLINPQAIEEYEKQKERYDFLIVQKDDLEMAKVNLMTIIKEINKTMERQFEKAFKEICQAFNDVFIKLFGGGTAELELTNKADILSSGVEIKVQLPEKKQQSLSVLSGGERALTVIALLFAFLKYKPAPFSVLDEIDAPLDEANIGRFCTFLKEYSQQTQFILVTHRKRTMEVADVLYGVTLEDAGVSKIISVKLNGK